MMVKHSWNKKWERGTKETVCTVCGITKKVVSGRYVYYEKDYTDLALFMFNAPSCLEQENSHFVNTPVMLSLPDPYKGELNSERIKAYADKTNEYDIEPSTVRDLFCAGIDWYRSKVKGNGA